ncbi:MAG TPA: hypothetical protein VGR47_04890 [Terracidiphilus sp.]|nr:hypothetical protein [Terracidiphilus sp.]
MPSMNVDEDDRATGICSRGSNLLACGSQLCIVKWLSVVLELDKVQRVIVAAIATLDDRRAQPFLRTTRIIVSKSVLLLPNVER